MNNTAINLANLNCLQLVGEAAHRLAALLRDSNDSVI
jgi:uncharacterized protein with HEPN domain